MRHVSIFAFALLASGGSAFAQGGVTMPADADVRAMQAPIDYQGSRSQATQEPDGVRSVFDKVPPAPVQVPAAIAAPLNPAHPDFTVDVWDDHDHLVETMAHCSDLPIGRAAFKEASKERPGLKVTLRQGEIVVATKDAGKEITR